MVKIRPKGVISLSYSDRLMMDCFLPLFKGFCQNIKTKKKNENLNFLLVGFTTFLSSRVFLLCIEMSVNIVFTLLLPGTHDSTLS